MKINRVCISEVTYKSSRSHTRACCVEVGIADLSGFAVVAADAGASVATLADALLVGADARATTYLWECMSTHCTTNQLPIEAAAAIDMALWDLRARYRNEPLWKALGGLRPRINVHLGGCTLNLDDERLAAWCTSSSDQFGFRAAVLEVDDQQDAARRLAIVQSALRRQPGSPSTLLLDARERWSADEAVRVINALATQFDLAWVESPTRQDDVQGYKRISDGIRGAVCGGAALGAVRAYLPYLKNRCVDVIQIDTAKVGITGAMQIADAAFGFELPVTLRASIGNVNAHVASVMPYCASVEVLDPLIGDGISSDVSIEDGWAIAGDRIGNGLVLDALGSRSAA